MVVPIRDFGNKFFLSSANMHSQQTIDLPTVTSSTNMRMDILSRNFSDNYDEVRGRTSSPKPQLSRTSLMFLTKSLVLYHKRMKLNNHLNEDINMKDDSPQLSYAIPKEQANQVSIAADPNNNMLNKHVPIECPVSSPPHVDDAVINIQLLYDPNASTESELWDGSFHPISLHKSIEYLVLDSKNIKNSLNFMAKYITNKQVNPTKSNDLEDFNGIGEVI